MSATILTYEEALRRAAQRNAPKAKSESHVRGAETRKAQQRARDSILAEARQRNG